MRGFLKIAGLTLGVILLVGYIYFLIFLPKQINLNSYLPEIQKIVKENSGINLEIADIKLETTPWLGVGIKAFDIKTYFDDKTPLANIPCVRAKVSLLNLLILNLRVSEVSVYKPYINLEIVDNKEFKAIKTVEKILYEKEKNNSVDKISSKEGFNPLSLIRIDVPNFNIYNYRIYLSDTLNKDYLLLSGDKTTLAYQNGKRAKLKTVSSLYLNKDEKLNIDLDINSFIPKPEKLDKEDDPDVRSEAPFINPVLVYKNYDLKGCFRGKLKIDENFLKGFINLEDFTLKLGEHRIPKSNLKFKTDKKTIYPDIDILITENQNLKLSGKFKLAKYPVFDLNIFSNGVYFNDLISLLKGTLDSIGIKNNLNNFEGRGFFVADAKIKTNSRSFKSKGNIEIKDGAIINKAANLGFTNINALFLLDNNLLEIKNTGLNINDGNLKIEGIINKKADTSIKINSNNLPLPEIYRAFAPDDIKKEIKLNSGKVSFEGNIKGKLKNATSNFKTEVSNLNLNNKLNTLIISNEKFTFDFNSDKKIEGNIKNKGFKISLPYAKSSIKDNLVEINFDDKKIELNPTQIQINNKSAITIKGVLDNYLKNPDVDFSLDGNLYAEELKALLGVCASPFIDAEGLIPIKARFSGNSKKQTLRAQIVSDTNNFITPVHIESILNNQTIIQALIDFKGNRIKIKNTGLYSKIVPSEFSDDFDLNMEDTNEITTIEGTITGIKTPRPVINLLKLNSKPLKINIAGFKNSTLKLESKLALFGNLNSPRAKGHFIVDELKLPDINVEMKKAKLLINGKEANLTTDGLNVNNSDMKITSNINLSKLPLISLNNFKFISEKLNADKIIETTDKLLSKIPADPVQRPQADIPVQISKGMFDIKNARTGNISADNIKGNLELFDNVLYIQSLALDAFKGKISGELDINLLNYLVNLDMKGKNMDADEALVVLANLKDTLSGKLSFDTKLSLQGLTYEEQVQSLNGDVNFLIEDGQAGPFSKIENIFLSENLRESEFFKSAMGSIITSAVSVDTSHFEELKGTIKFNKTGVANLDPITMKGSALCIKIGGEMNLLENILYAHVRGRLGSMAESLLGPLSNVNPVNIVKATPGLNVVMAKTFSVFCEKISQEEMDLIPDFSKDRSDLAATKFQLILRGDVNKPLSLLKSFKWLVTEEEYDNAEQFVSSVPENLPEGVSTLEELRAYQDELSKIEAENKTIKGKIKNLFKKNKTEQI